MLNRKEYPFKDLMYGGLWWTLVLSLIATLMVSGYFTVSVQQAVAPVLMSFLCIMRPEVAFRVVLADGLAV